MLVDASDEEEAEEIARAALGEYPTAIVGNNVKRMVTTAIEHYIPRSIEITKMHEEKSAS